MRRYEAVNALISNGHWDEQERSWLMNLPQHLFDKNGISGGLVTTPAQGYVSNRPRGHVEELLPMPSSAPVGNKAPATNAGYEGAQGGPAAAKRDSGNVEAPYIAPPTM